MKWDEPWDCTFCGERHAPEHACRVLNDTETQRPFVLLELVGWRSPKTGNLFRPGLNSEKDWAADGFEPVYVVRSQSWRLRSDFGVVPS